MPSSDDLLPTLEIYRGGELISHRIFPRCLLSWWLPRSPRPERTYLRLKIRDLVSAAWFTVISLHFSRRADLVIGVECLNALWGRGMQLLGLARKTVYYLFDFSPRRYPSRLFNRLYLFLDRAATYSASATWNISPAMEEARIQLGYHPRRMARQLTVPYGLERMTEETAGEAPGEEIRLAYAGGLNDENGVMLLPEMLEILARRFPGVTLTVMGAGSREDDLRHEFRQRGTEELVTFRGYLPAEEAWNLLRGCHLGLAPYYPAETTKMFGDVIKIKTYLSAGLPVITTPVPPIARDVAERAMGEVVPYDASRWAEAVAELSRDRDRYLACRRNALEFVRGQTWNKILARAVAETFADGGENGR